MIQHSISEVIAELILEKDMGRNPSHGGPWPVFIDSMGENNNEAIAVAHTGGPTQGRNMRTGRTVYHAEFQVRIRHTSNPAARTKTYEIFNMFENLEPKHQIPVEDVLYEIQCINQVVTPAYIGPDEQGRPSFVLNCNASYREVLDDNQ